MRDGRFRGKNFRCVFAFFGSHSTELGENHLSCDWGGRVRSCASSIFVQTQRDGQYVCVKII
jgi:hypothetical protein